MLVFGMGFSLWLNWNRERTPFINKAKLYIGLWKKHLSFKSRVILEPEYKPRELIKSIYYFDLGKDLEPIWRGMRDSHQDNDSILNNYITKFLQAIIENHRKSI